MLRTVPVEEQGMKKEKPVVNQGWQLTFTSLLSAC